MIVACCVFLRDIVFFFCAKNVSSRVRLYNRALRGVTKVRMIGQVAYFFVITSRYEGLLDPQIREKKYLLTVRLFAQCHAKEYL